MRIQKPSCFTDEEAREELLYGPEGEYKSIELDFWKNIYPVILERYISGHEPDNNYQNTFLDPTFYPIGIDQTMLLVTRAFTNVFVACFEYDFSICRENKFTNEEIEQAKEKKGLLGAIARIDKHIGVIGRLFFRILLAIVKEIPNKTIKLSQHMPLPLYDDFVKEIKTPFYMLAEMTGHEEIREEIDKIRFLKHPNALKKIPSPKHYRIEKISYNRTVLIFENINFSKKNQELFWELLSFPGCFYTNDIVFFLNCRFSSHYRCDKEKLTSRVFFRHCIFEKEFAPANLLDQSWKIIGCKIFGRFNLSKTFFSVNFTIEDCIFNTGSEFLMDYSSSKDKKNLKESKHKIGIYNTIFGGLFSAKDCNFRHVELTLSNVSFFDLFYFDHMKMGKNNRFEQIAFGPNFSPQMRLCKETFLYILRSNGYTKISQLLSTPTIRTQTSKTSRHPLSLMGWFAPKEAARILGKSTSWLAKKRMADKKKRTKKSIPFVGERKGILYPEEALVKYRLQEWNVLQELCDRYGIGEKEDIKEDLKKED